MSVELSVYQAGLVFSVNKNVDQQTIEGALDRVLDKSEGYTAAGSVAPNNWQMTYGETLIWLHLEKGGERSQKLRITLHLLGETAEESAEDDVKSTLARITASLAQAFEAESVMWLSRDTRLPAEAFIAAALEGVEETKAQASNDATRVFPRRVKPRPAQTKRPEKSDAAVQMSQNMRLRYRLYADTIDKVTTAMTQQVSLPLRLASWVMTLMVAVFSVPLAWVLFAYNLNRGGDFRATAQILVAVSSFSVLHATGTTQVIFQMIFG